MKSRWSEDSNAERPECNTVCFSKNGCAFVEGEMERRVAGAVTYRHALWQAASVGEAEVRHRKCHLRGKKTGKVEGENCRGGGGCMRRRTRR